MITINPSNSADDASLPPNGASQNLEDKTEDNQTQATKTDETKKKIPLASIPATISIGLLIALLYLGGRIITAQRPAKTAVVKVSAPVPAAQAAPPPVAAKPADMKPADVKPVDVKPVDVKSVEVQPVAAVQPAASQAPPAAATKQASATPVVNTGSDSSDGNDALPMITPQAGEHYIQVGALDMSAEATRRFVQRLRGDKLDPHVAPGPTPALMRVLIGPFDNRDVLNEKKAQLDAEGLDSFIRKY